MNFILLYGVTFLMIFIVCGEEIQIKHSRRSKYQKTSTSTSSSSTTTTTEVNKVDDYENNDENFNEDKSIISHKSHEEPMTTTETLKKATRPTRNNQALFNALKKRRKELYQNKAGKDEQQQEIKESTLQDSEKKPTKKSSTYRNKNKNYQKKDIILDSNEAVVPKTKIRRFST